MRRPKQCVRQFHHPPHPSRVPGAGLSRQHQVLILAFIQDRSGQILGSGQTRHLCSSGPSTFSSRLAPGHPVPLTCRRSVAGCHIFQPRGLAEETLARLCRWRRGARGWGARGCGAASHLGWASAGCASGGRRPPRGGRWGAASGRRRRGAQLPATCGHGREPAVLAQLREDCAAPPGPTSARRRRRQRRRRRRRPLPPPPPPPPPGPARSEHARGRPPPARPGARIPAAGAAESRRGECAEARTGGPAPPGSPGWDGVWEREEPGEGGLPESEPIAFWGLSLPVNRDL